MTIDAGPDRLLALTDRLCDDYPQASRHVITGCVDTAMQALTFFGSSEDEDMLGLMERIAERDLRLRLGIEREVARLDPEDHRRSATA